MKSNITGTSKHGRSIVTCLCDREKHDSADRRSQLFWHVQKDSFVPTRETPADRAERLAVIARLRCIYSDDFISATYGDIN